MHKQQKKVIKPPKVIYCFIPALIIILWACSSTRTDVTPSAGDESPTLILTEIPEEAIVATEHMIQTQNALTQAVLPTLTRLPTVTPTQPFANLSTLTPIPNSTPAGVGAFLDVAPDILGSKYEIQNVYYFDTLEGQQRYEIYAGAIAGSGGEETAQGVVIVRVLRIVDNGNLSSEVVEIREYLTPVAVGPIRVSIPMHESEQDPLVLSTSLGYSFIFLPLSGEIRENPVPPRATLEINGHKQLAGLGHSFCWLGSCQDGPGIRTSTLPLVARPSFLARLRLPLTDLPQSLQLSAMKVPSTDLPSDQEYMSWTYTEAPIDLGELPLQREQDLSLSFEPGRYVLIVFAKWEDYGDVSYGFLIDVRE